MRKGKQDGSRERARIGARVRLWRVVRAPEGGQGTLPSQEVTFSPDAENEGSVGELAGG